MAYKGTLLAFPALLTGFVASVVASAPLVPRQSTDYECNVNTTYTTLIGLEFDIYPCTVNQGAGDTLEVFVTDTAEQCMNNCTQVGKYGGACVAMVWGTVDNKCWLVNNSMTVDNLVYSNITITSFVSDLSLFENRDASCTNSDKNTRNNLTFEVFCGRDVGDDITPWMAVNGTTDHHSDSLDDCIQHCSTMRPKCYGVTYNPGLTIGYRNCFPKGAAATSSALTTYAESQVALAQFASDFNTSCSQGNYNTTGADGVTFSMTCDATADGRNLSTVYAASFGDCMDICATHSQASDFCNAVLYQPNGDDGYENCYLLADGRSNGTRSEWRMALRTDNSGQPVEGSSGATNTAGGSSKAWIAGPVVGVVAAVAILLGACFWWRKRQSKNKSLRQRQILDTKPRWQNPSELDSNFTERQELNGQQSVTAELPGSDGTWRGR